MIVIDVYYENIIHQQKGEIKMKCCYCECELTEDNMGSETTCIMCHEMFEKEFDSQFDVMIDDTENM